jgi:hypothetical protein
MEDTIYMVQGDTGPTRVFNIRRDKQNQYDFTGGTARFAVLNVRTNTITNTGHQDCVVTGAGVGSMKAEYHFQTGDLPDAGEYRCELIIGLPSGTEHSYKTIKIHARAAVA